MNILDLVKSISTTDPWGNAMVAIRFNSMGRIVVAPVQSTRLLGEDAPQILITLDQGNGDRRPMRKHALMKELMVHLQRAPMSELTVQVPDCTFAQPVREFGVEDVKGMIILDLR